MCHGSKLTDSLKGEQNWLTPWETTTWTFNMIRSCSLKPLEIFEPAGVKQTISSLFSSFELGGITRLLMTDPTGNSECCFLSTSKIEGLWETKLTVSFDASHEVFSVERDGHHGSYNVYNANSCSIGTMYQKSASFDHWLHLFVEKFSKLTWRMLRLQLFTTWQV